MMWASTVVVVVWAGRRATRGTGLSCFCQSVAGAAAVEQGVEPSAEEVLHYQVGCT